MAKAQEHGLIFLAWHTQQCHPLPATVDRFRRARYRRAEPIGSHAGQPWCHLTGGVYPFSNGFLEARDQWRVGSMEQSGVCEDRRQSRRQRLQPLFQRDQQTIGQKRNESMGFDSGFELVIDGTDRQIVLQLLERLLDLDQLQIEPPQMAGIIALEL